MNKRFFVKNLLSWNAETNDRSMPWKHEKDPYKIWLSEIILQQTRVEQGWGYYERFIRRFPNVAALATAPEMEVMKLWEGLGYYTRCRNLIATAKYIHDELNDKFPADYQSIASLKGVGPYTAAAIASFAYRLPHAVVDGNVKRVLARFFGIETPADTTAGKKVFENLAGRLLDMAYPDIYNQAIMDFGATVCKPVNPLCEVCPLNKHCKAYHDGTVQILPRKQRKLTIRTRYFNYLILRYEDMCYLRRRKGKDIWKGLFEFPCVESTHLLAAHEIERMLAADGFSGKNRCVITRITKPAIQQLTHQKIIAQFCFLEIKVKPDNFYETSPVSVSELDKFIFPKIILQEVKRLQTNN